MRHFIVVLAIENTGKGSGSKWVTRHATEPSFYLSQSPAPRKSSGKYQCSILER